MSSIRFRGSQPVTLDTKGRIVLPAKFRKLMQDACQGKIVLTRSPRGCVLIYPWPQWQQKRAEIESNLRLDWAVSSMLLDFEEEQNLDESARITIPLSLREACKLVKNIQLIGGSDFISVWESERYEAELKRDLEQAIPQNLKEQLLALRL